jgi:RecB family exonuclease
MQKVETTCAECASTLHKDCAVQRDGLSYCDQHASAQVVKLAKEYSIPDVIRRSYIELYKKCPYSFYLQVIKGLEVPGTIYTQLGIDLHNYFDQASNNKEYSHNDMINDFNIIWTKYPDEWKSDKMYQRGIESINSFYELLPTFPDKPFVTEKTIEFDVGADLPKVSITMDRIDEVDDMLDITDYKTGTVIVGQRISSDLQPPLYIKAVRDHFNRPVRRFRLIYLQEGKERVYERVDDDNYVCIVRKREYKINITESVKEVQKIFQHIKNGEFNIPNDTKSMFFTCKMCHFKENGTCRGAEEEIWYQK